MNDGAVVRLVPSRAETLMTPCLTLGTSVVDDRPCMVCHGAHLRTLDEVVQVRRVVVDCLVGELQDS